MNFRPIFLSLVKMSLVNISCVRIIYSRDIHKPKKKQNFQKPSMDRGNNPTGNELSTLKCFSRYEDVSNDKFVQVAI